MAVSKDKIRASVALDKETYKKLQELAGKERRSISNLVSLIVEEYLNNK